MSTRSPRNGTPSASSSLRWRSPFASEPSARTIRCQGTSGLVALGQHRAREPGRAGRQVAIGRHAALGHRPHAPENLLRARLVHRERTASSTGVSPETSSNVLPDRAGRFQDRERARRPRRRGGSPRARGPCPPHPPRSRIVGEPARADDRVVEPALHQALVGPRLRLVVRAHRVGPLLRPARADRADHDVAAARRPPSASPPRRSRPSACAPARCPGRRRRRTPPRRLPRSTPTGRRAPPCRTPPAPRRSRTARRRGPGSGSGRVPGGRRPRAAGAA